MGEKEQTPRFLNDILVEKKLGEVNAGKFSLHATAKSLIDDFGRIEESCGYKRNSTDWVEFKKDEDVFRARLTAGVFSLDFTLHIFSVAGKSQNKLGIYVSLSPGENLIETGGSERELTNKEEGDLAKFFIKMKKKLEVLKEKEIKNGF